MGEILGLIIGTAAGLGSGATIGLSVVLAFLFGYTLSSLPLLRSGLTLGAALRLVLAADTVSILTMEAVDNLVMAVIPGAMNAGLVNAVFWVGMSISLVAAFFAAYPVNRYLLARGRGHALRHEHHGGSGPVTGAGGSSRCCRRRRSRLPSPPSCSAASSWRWRTASRPPWRRRRTPPRAPADWLLGPLPAASRGHSGVMRTRDDVSHGAAPVVLDLPFRGSWLARNSPARRVPSHGTHLFGTTYAIDFVAVDERGLPAPRTWRTALSVEAPALFRGFGQPVLAPVPGRVVIAHDGEVDHVARRSQLTLVAYAVGQRGRVRGGPGAIAGNHVVVALGPAGPFVLVAHLRQGSVRVVARRSGGCGGRAGRVRQLRQQHPAAHPRPGDGLGGLAVGARPPDALPSRVGRRGLDAPGVRDRRRALRRTARLLRAKDAERPGSALRCRCRRRQRRGPGRSASEGRGP